MAFKVIKIISEIEEKCMHSYSNPHEEHVY